MKRMKYRLPIQAWLLYILAALFLTTGITLSKYITTTNGDDSAQIISFGDLSLTETGDFYEENRMLVQPGVDLEKKAVLSFAGADTAVYIFVRVKTADWDVNADHTQYSCLSEKIHWEIDSENWTYLQSDAQEAVYYKMLPANTALPETSLILEDTIHVSNTLKRSELEQLDDISISFQGYAVQYDLTSNLSEQEHILQAWSYIA